MNIRLDYCRPYIKGRKIFGELLPYRVYWRTGAKKSTLVEFSGDIRFGDQKIIAGKYRVYTIPDESEWVIALNSEFEKWDAWEPDYSLDVARMNVPVGFTSSLVDQFLVEMNETEKGADIVLSWDDTRVVVPITFILESVQLFIN